MDLSLDLSSRPPDAIDQIARLLVEHAENTMVTDEPPTDSKP